MRILVVTMVLHAVILSPCAAQRTASPIWEMLDSLSESTDGPPTLDEIFSDIGDLLKTADESKVAVLETRLAETEEEITHLENLQATLKRGILIEMPDILKERLNVPVSRDALEREQKKIDELKMQMRFLAERRTRQEKGRDVGEPERAVAVTHRGSAALDVVLRIPEPPKRPAATEQQIQDAVDKVLYGKALYLARDYEGALKSYGLVPEEKRSLEIKYHMARCHELLDRWDDAKTLYTSVSTADPKGHWGGLARWMLDLGTQKQGIRGLIKASKGKGSE